MKTRTAIILMASIMTLALVFFSCQSPTEPIPSTPVKILATPLSQSAIKISWTSSAKSYEVYRDGAKVADVKDPLFVDSGLDCGKTYVYAVVSVNGTSKSEMSETISTETDQCTPGAPLEVSGSPLGPTSVSISWKLNPPYTATGIRPIWKQRDTMPEIDWYGSQSPAGSTNGIVSYLPPGRKGYPAAVSISVSHGRWYFSPEATGTIPVATNK